MPRRASGRRAAAAAAAAGCFALLGAGALAAPAASLELVGHDGLGGRGLNAGLALAGRCAYVGSRGQGPVAILDVSDPGHPRGVGAIPGRPNTTARELRAVDDLHLLVVMSFALGRGGLNRFDLFRWDSDCARPSAAGSFDFGAAAPHEFFLWRDPGRPQRVLLFTAMFAGGAPGLRVVDVSDPAHPLLAGSWQPPAGPLHSVSIAPDGRRAYLSLWTSGLALADVSDFTAGRANPQVRPLTPAGSFLAPRAGGNVHSAVAAPDDRFVITTDERYPPGCPYGPARLVDAADPAHLRVLSVLAAPENDLQACRQAPVGAYTSHNPTLTRDLALVTWYSSGLQVFDTSDPSQPARLAEYRPDFGQPGSLDPQLGSTAAISWSYPIIRDGLIYFADVNQGLVILRYRGPHEEEIAATGFAEGNSNLARGVAPASTAASNPAPQRASGAGSLTPRSQAPDWLPAIGLAALGLAALVAGLAIARRARR